MSDEAGRRPELRSTSGDCRVCGRSALEEIAGFSRFRRVTSDCRPWPSGGRLGVCRACGCVQKPDSRELARELALIYDGYAIYHQGGGAEQAVFGASGQAVSRSSRLVEALRSQVCLPPKGQLLDVGCGNGATLRAFGATMPGWSLVGTELDDRNRPEIESIGGVEGFFVCPVSDVPGHFDMVTMVHVLEHVPRPVALVEMAWAKLSRGGLLLIHLPDYTRNPFDLLIADHCTHFTAETAVRLIRRATGADVTAVHDWVPKELTVVVRAVAVLSRPQPSEAPADALGESIAQELRWLSRLAEAARSIARRGRFGLFGTSIAATWLFAELEEAVDFFVDEDRNRVGRSFLGRPVYHPDQTPAGSQVYLVLPAVTAKAIRPRVAREGVDYHLPPQR